MNIFKIILRKLSNKINQFSKIIFWKKLFNSKWHDFLNFEKREYTLHKILYIDNKSSKSFCIQTRENNFINFKIINNTQLIKKIIKVLPKEDIIIVK